MSSGGAEKTVLRRDRIVVLSGLVAITALSWAYVASLASEVQNMEMAMPQMRAWGAADFVLVFVMWAVMMIAMMTPSAAPMILMFKRSTEDAKSSEFPTYRRVYSYWATWWSGPPSAAWPAQPSGGFIPSPCSHRW